MGTLTEMTTKESRIIREIREAMEDLKRALMEEQKPEKPKYLYVYKMEGAYVIAEKGKTIPSDCKFIGKIKLEQEDDR